MSFAVGVFAFTLRAVGQESFDDVVVPDAPVGGKVAGGTVNNNTQA